LQLSRLVGIHFGGYITRQGQQRPFNPPESQELHSLFNRLLILLFYPPRRNHNYVIQIRRYAILVLPEGLSEQSLQSIAYDGIAAVFADGNAKSRMAAIIFSRIHNKQLIAGDCPARQNNLESAVSDKSFALRKRKLLQNFTVKLSVFLLRLSYWFIPRNEITQNEASNI